MDAHHAHNFWGHSAALDLQQLAAAAAERQPSGDAAERPSGDAFAALQVAPGDCRHTATLLCRACRHGARAVQVYVYEGHAEGLARHMLLLSVLLDDALPPRERVQLFLELHGNARLRERSAAYLAARGKLLADVTLADGRAAAPAAGAAPDERARLTALFDLSQLRFKERDALVDVFSSYALRVPFDVERLRDERLRSFYGDRYDARQAVHDWDYHMRLAGAGGAVVHAAQFARWRDDGLAVQFRDASAPAPNRSLASAARGVAVSGLDRNGAEQGRQVLKRGFWGDIVNSPYTAFGVAAEAPDAARLFRLRNREHVFTAVDVAAHNVTALIHELRTGERYRMPPPPPDEATDEEAAAAAAAEDAATTPAPAAAADAAALDAAPAPLSGDPAAQCCADGPAAAAALARCRVTLLTGDVERAVLGRAALDGALHAVTLSTAHARLLSQGLERLAAPHAVLALESAQFVLALKPAQAAAFTEHAGALAAAAGWRPLPLPGGEAAPPGHLLFTRGGGGDGV